MTRAILIPLLFLPGSAVLAKDPDFDAVVRSIESHYHTRRTCIPFLGLANFIVKIARPAGVHGFRLAVFEDLNYRATPADLQFDALVRNTVSQAWRPLVKVHSRRDGEWTHIYARDLGSRIKLLVATFERREATVLEVKLHPEELVRSLEEPRSMGRHFHSH